jgi:transposase-like protein
VDCEKEKRRILTFGKQQIRSEKGSEKRKGHAMRREAKCEPVGQGEVIAISGKVRSALDEVLREGARQMLLAAIETEVNDYIEKHQQERDGNGHCLVVRNGRGKERGITTPMGELRLRVPRVNDKRRDEDGRRRRFTSAILPPYLRKTRSVEELIPWLYLKGISTGDFSEALAALLGPDAPGLSATTVVRLKEVWRGEYDTWRRRDLSGERYVYLWADGIYCNVRLDDERQCFLVIIGATEDGQKRLLAVADGFRESELSWMDVLQDLKKRGMTEAPKLAVADGGLGFWAALRKVFPTTREQRCWVHKTANVLDKMPKSSQGKAKKMLHDIYLAETKDTAEKAFDEFLVQYRVKLPKAVECLEKDRAVLLAFYDFPAEHWAHLRTTNPIESTFASVRLRHRRTKGCGSREASLTMVFMLARQAERHWRRLKGAHMIVHIIEGKQFKDGILVTGNAA